MAPCSLIISVLGISHIRGVSSKLHWSVSDYFVTRLSKTATSGNITLNSLKETLDGRDFITCLLIIQIMTVSRICFNACKIGVFSARWRYPLKHTSM